MTSPQRAPGGFPVVGIIGGGQLARMCQPPAVGLAVTLSVLAETPDASAALVVPSAPVGDYTDVETVREWARSCDVVTFDHEHVPAPVLAALEADGVPLHPSPAALVFAQDKLAMRRRLSEVGVGCPRWAAVRTAEELKAFGEDVGWPVVVKTPRGGYDGKGVRVVGSVDEAADWLEASARDAASGGPLAEGLLAEEKVEFTRELAVLVARSPSGQAATWPVVETVQVDGICTEVLAPAPGMSDDLSAELTEAALRVAGALEVTGVMAVEMFEVSHPHTGEPDYVVNELAMRPHNSGHWSIDGAVTSQFENHLRAVLDLPLGSTAPRAPWTVMANVLGGDYPELYPAYRHIMARDPGARFHLYGKGVRPGRKIGHVNVSGDDLADLRERAGHAADYLRGVVTE
ncbi:5-(carboxyamino)imidazole ribonucleotide synthase [Oryzihumus leptocrescens]|uniref:N5-carboxyaminoimidazole ribonucleotide synthase n=1 Tax=Oryzihumus leptocrescens TaxID=297536 RepID=A0A542ZG52_9MICO|nr:5-(carboxyamino)imidazole ribonucleotide synthase [Oryzihumus leptocrescens]TQL59318.1 5-(carboxyamino)imidazole ribonucleotide synthase [Oryzihumus leptocrescens]